MLKSNYLKNNNKKGIEWIIIIEMDLIFIIGEIIRYYKKNKNSLQEKGSSCEILNILSLQPLVVSKRKKKRGTNLEEW